MIGPLEVGELGRVANHIDVKREHLVASDLLLGPLVDACELNRLAQRFQAL